MKKASMIFIAILLALCMGGCACKHRWEDATCTRPMICAKCGAVEGEALGHEWKEATCEKAKTCMRCGEESGEPLGHSWEEATCDRPKTCSRCGQLEGAELGHDWEEADCTHPRQCKRCGETEGEALPHTAGDWSEGIPDYVNCTITTQQRCTVCGHVMDSKTQKIDSLYENGTFLMTPAEFTERYNEVLSDSFPDFETRLVSASADSLGCVIFKNRETNVGAVLFYDENMNFINDRDEHGVSQFMIGFYDVDKDDIARAMLAAAMTVDPTLSFEDARALAIEFVKDPEICNGIRYGFAELKGSYYLSISIA